MIHRRHLELAPILLGGHQERGRRPGSEATASIAGLGAAVEFATSELEANCAHVRALTGELRGRLSAIEGLRIYGDPEANVGNTLSVGVAGCEGQLLLINLDLMGIMVSTGSACTAGTLDPSPVLLALGCSPEEGRSVLRISVGAGTTAAEVEAFVDALPEVISRVRAEA